VAIETLLHYRSKTLLLKNYRNYNNAFPQQKESHLPNIVIAFTLVLQQSRNILEHKLGSNKTKIILSYDFIVTFKLSLSCKIKNKCTK
jgi:hypothetical protein